MSEKLHSNNNEIKAERLTPADRYRVDSEKYPIFRLQGQDNLQTESVDLWGIDRTVSEYVTDTANLIARIDGTAEKYERDKNLKKPDHVIYLDKSARPVSWFVNAFWEDFSDGERPEHSYLNIDRLDWLRRVGLRPDGKGYIENENTDGKRRATANDFIERADKLPKEFFAGIRALYVDGGVDTDDPDEIMKMPTVLDGKNLLIVDEVISSGATLGIAQYLLKKAIPELNSVDGEYFWKPEFAKVGKDGTETQRLSVPVWYHPSRTSGRGIGEIDEKFHRERYEEYPTPRNRARKLGGFVLGRPADLRKEEGAFQSREVAEEILQMRDDYRKGKVFLGFVENWTDDRTDEYVESQGLRYAPGSDRSPDTVANVRNAIYSRKSDLYK